MSNILLNLFKHNCKALCSSLPWSCKCADKLAKSGSSLDTISVNSASRLLSNNRVRHLFFKYFILENAASYTQRRNKGGGHNSPGDESLWWPRITAGSAEWPRRALKSPNNVTSTFFDTVHWLPEDLRFEHGGAKLASCPGRRLTSLRPCVHVSASVKNESFFLANSCSFGYSTASFHVSSTFSSSLKFFTSWSLSLNFISSIWRCNGAPSISTSCGKATSLIIFEVLSKSWKRSSKSCNTPSKTPEKGRLEFCQLVHLCWQSFLSHYSIQLAHHHCFDQLLSAYIFKQIYRLFIL